MSETLKDYKASFRYSKCRVLRIVDGDTFDALIDLGFGVFTKKRIRMWGINTPESRTRDLAEKKLGLAAKESLKTLLEGGTCDIESLSIGKYGRVLGVAWVDGLNINIEMLKTAGTTEYYGGKR